MSLDKVVRARDPGFPSTKWSAGWWTPSVLIFLVKEMTPWSECLQNARRWQFLSDFPV